MHRSIGVLAACFLSIALVGCTSDPVRAPSYEGKPVTIGIIGTPPAIRERNVNFEQINFGQLEEVDASYGLQNDEPNRSDIEDVYTRIFETITHIEAEVNS